jgi:hypothetical protein
MNNTYEKGLTISKAIQIPTRQKNEQYSIKNTAFDPTQNSPPSMWKMRLNKRVSTGSGITNPSSLQNEFSKKSLECK